MGFSSQAIMAVLVVYQPFLTGDSLLCSCLFWDVTQRSLRDIPRNGCEANETKLVKNLWKNLIVKKAALKLRSSLEKLTPYSYWSKKDLYHYALPCPPL